MSLKFNYNIIQVVSADDFIPSARRKVKELQLDLSGHFTLTSVCVRALPVRHYCSQANRRGVVAELLDAVAKHRFV